MNETKLALMNARRTENNAKSVNESSTILSSEANICSPNQLIPLTL
jgi:hypothetical protein